MPIGRAGPALRALAMLLMATSLDAAFNVTITSSGAQSGGSFIKGVWTPTNPSSVILVASLMAELEQGDVTILTAGKGLEPGNITIQSVLPLDDLITTKAPTLTLHAFNDVVINAPLSQTTKGGDDKPTRVHLVLNANSDRSGAGSVQMNSSIALAGGTLTASGATLTQSVGAVIQTTGGAIELRADGDLIVNAPVSGGGGAVALRANADASGGGNLFVAGPVTTLGLASITLAGVNLTQAGTGTVSAADGNVAGSFTGAANVSRPLSSVGGTLSISSANLTLDAALAGGGGVTLSSGVLTGNAGGTITAQNRPILITAAAAADLIDSIQSNGGAITIQAGSTLDLGAGILSSAGGAITLISSGNMTLTGPVVTSGGSLRANVTGVGTLGIQNDITTAGGALEITTASGLLQSTAGSTLDASGGAGLGSIRVESLSASGSVLLNGNVIGAVGSTILRAGGDLTINASVAGVSIVLQANSDNGALGSLAVNAPVSALQSGTLTVSGVNFTQSLAGTLSTAAGALAGTFSGSATITRSLTSATGPISLSAPTLTLNAALSGGGGVTLSAASIIGNAGGNISSQNHPILITAAAAADLIDSIQSNGGAITIQAGSTLDLGAGILSSAGGAITLISSGNMALTGPIVTSGGSLRANVTGVGTLGIQNDITTAGGALEFTTASGLLQSTSGSTLDASGGAGLGSIRVESLSASGSVLLNGNVIGAVGSTILRAGGDLTINASVAGSSIVLQANSDNGALGSLAVNAPVSALQSGTLTVSGVNFTQSLTGTLSTAAGALAGTFSGSATITRSLTSVTGPISLSAPTLTLNAALSGGGGVTLSAASIIGNAGGNISSQNHPILITAAAAADLIDSIQSNGGAITIQAGSTLDLGAGILSSAGGAITLISSGNMALTGPVVTSGGSLRANVTGVGTLGIQNDITTSGGNIDLTTANALLQSSAGSDLDASGGAGTGSIRVESLGLSAPLTLSGPVIGSSGKVTLRAGGHLTLNAAVNAVGSGGIDLIANSLNGPLGNLALNAPVTLNGTGPIHLNGISLTQSGSGTLASLGGPISGTFSATILFSRNVASGGGRIAFTGLGGISVESLLSTAPPAGGVGRLLTSSGVTLKTNPILGNADIVLIGTPVQRPVLVDPVASDASPTTIRLGASVKDDGGMQILERGVVLALASINPEPTLDGTGVTRIVSPGTLGAFSVIASSLVPGQSYAFRAYATNATGASYTKSGTFSLPTPIQDWRRQFFGSTANAGNAANDATPDGDGIPNLVKYALVLTPGKALASDLPSPTFVQVDKVSHLAIELLRDPSRTDVLIHVEASDDLHDWSIIASSLRGAPYDGKGFVSERVVQRSLRLALIRDLADASVQPFRYLRVRVEPTSKD